MNIKATLCFIPLFFSLLFFASGEEADYSSLVRGPVKTVGFPLIYPNAIETWQGYYRYLNNEVLVSFTTEKIVIPKEWEEIACEELTGFSPDLYSFYFKDEKWSLLFQFSDESGITVDSGSYCTFADKFVTRLRYLLRDREKTDSPLLPAILEF